MHEMELLISGTDEYRNAAPILIKRMDGAEITSSLIRHDHDQREGLRCWWEYSKPRKRRGGQQGNSIIVINSSAIKNHDIDPHRFTDQICLALLLTLICHHFFQVRETLMAEKEAANLIMCSCGNHVKEHAKPKNIKCVDGEIFFLRMALYGTRINMY